MNDVLKGISFNDEIRIGFKCIKKGFIKKLLTSIQQV